MIGLMINARVLASRLADLLRCERAAMAEFLVALSEFDRQRSWADLGYPSLFDFLHRDLGVSAGAAHYRKIAAELMQKFPEIVEPLRDGRLCITTIVQLAKVLTPENCHDVLPRFFQRSKREAMALAAELQPATAAPHRDVITALLPVAPPLLPSRPAFQPVEVPGMPSSNPERAFQPVEIVGTPVAPNPGRASNSTEALPTSPAPIPVRRDSSQPLTGELSRLHITVSKRFLEKLEAARDALSHARPGASAEAILEAGARSRVEATCEAEGAGGETAQEGGTREPRHSDREGKARGMDARWWALPVAARFRRRLRLRFACRVRSLRHTARPGRFFDTRQHAAALPGA
jgi:hypothetical protein